MAKKHKPEEIVAKLRQIDVLTSQATPIVDAIRSIGVMEVTYYRWRNEYGGLKSQTWTEQHQNEDEASFQGLQRRQGEARGDEDGQDATPTDSEGQYEKAKQWAAPKPGRERHGVAFATIGIPLIGRRSLAQISACTATPPSG
jgi:hypothetical protein